MKKYVAAYEYHQPRLAEIEVLNETEKTIVRGEMVEIIRSFYCLPDRLRKDNYNIFDTQNDALNWLILTARNDIND